MLMVAKQNGQFTLAKNFDQVLKARGYEYFDYTILENQRVGDKRKFICFFLTKFRENFPADILGVADSCSVLIDFSDIDWTT